MRDPKVEQWLTREMVQFEYVSSIAISDIDLEASLKNNSRVGNRLIPWLHERYTVAAKSGDEFPAIIVYRLAPGPAKFRIVEGNHRAHGYLSAGKTSIDAYVIQATMPVIDVLTRSANAMVGVATTPEDNLNQAIYSVSRGYQNIGQASESFNVTLNSLQSALLANKAKERLAGLRVGKAKPDDLSTFRLQRLNTIPNDPALKAAAAVALSSQLTSDQFDDLITAVKAQRSEEYMLLAVEEFKAKPGIVAQEVATKGGTHRAPKNLQDRNKINRVLNIMDKILEDYTSPTELHLGREEILAIQKRLRKTSFGWERFLGVGLIQTSDNGTNMSDATRAAVTTSNLSTPRRVEAQGFA